MGVSSTAARANATRRRWPPESLTRMTAKTDFKMIPGQTELEQIERDLRFHPAVNDNPRTLSRDQIAQFNREGYIRGIRIFSESEISAIRGYFDELLAKTIAAAPRDRVIVTGDFNSTPWSFSRRRWDEAFTILRRDRAIATWPANRYKRLPWLGAPFLPIDHVYAGSDWATVKVERGPEIDSDHYPLVMTLTPRVKF